MSKNSTLCAQIGTSATLSIEGLSDQSQVLITLCHNDSQWLSPAGWSENKKGTLLDCHVKSERTLIEIPAEFKDALKTGDKLHIICESLGLDQILVWSAPEAAIKTAEDISPAPAIAASALSAGKGLLSRLKGDAETQAPPSDISDVERQAQAAQKAAADMRAKMENAQAAKEAAHQRALEAARLAEEARKTEEAQIAQMETVERNLREAEAARREELAQLEEERRAEEARKVEAARLAEEARQLEELRRQKAALAARRKTLTQDLDIEVEARVLAQSQADKLSDALATHEVNVQSRSLEITDAEQLAAKDEAALSRSEAALLSARSKLEALAVEQTKDKQALDTLAADKTRTEKAKIEVNAELAKARQALEQAKARVKAAESQAEKMAQSLEALSQSEQTLREQAAMHSSAYSDAEGEAKKALVKFEGAQAAKTQSQEKQQVLKQQAQILQKEQSALELKAKQAGDELVVITKREETMRAGIAMIDSGKSLSDVDACLSNMPGLYQSPALESPANDESGLFDGFKRKIAASRFGSSTPTLYADGEVTNKNVPIPFVKKDAVGETSADNDSSDLRKALIASVAAVAFVGIVGFGMSKITPATASAPKPADTITPEKTKTPEPVFDLETLKAPEMAKIKNDEVATETPEPVFDLSEETVSPLDISISDDAHKAAHTVSVAKETETLAITSIETLQEKPMVDTKAELASKRPELTIVKPRSKVQTTKKPKVKAVTEPETVSVSSRVRLEQIAKLKTVQSDLQTLGFYDGKIDGLPGGNTDAAIIEFKGLFGLPKDKRVTPKFVTELSKASEQIMAAKLTPPKPVIIAPPVVTPVQAPNPVAETAPVTVSTPVLSQPTPEPVKTASIAPIIPTQPVPADIVVDAKRLGALGATYPKRALRRNFYKTVSVELTFDIDSAGNVLTAEATSVSDEAGRYRDDFIKAGLKAINAQKFTPKSVNGVAVDSTGHKSKIVFRTE